MLTQNDLLQLRGLLFSDRITWRGNEINDVLQLASRINAQLESMKEPTNADGPRPTE